MLVKSKFFIFFDYITVNDNDVETINIICKNFRLKLFKNVNNQFDIISCVKIAFVVNNVKIVNQIIHASINLWFVNIKAMYDNFADQFCDLNWCILQSDFFDNCYDSDRLIISRGARTTWLINFLNIWEMFRKSWLIEYRGYCRGH